MLYQDLALMRIVEPASKLRTIQLLEQHFNVLLSLLGGGWLNTDHLLIFNRRFNS